MVVRRVIVVCYGLFTTPYDRMIRVIEVVPVVILTGGTALVVKMDWYSFVCPLSFALNREK